MVAVTEMTNWAVDLIDVRKTYRGGIHALRGVNVQVGRGEIFGLLGPAGAGKSTLVKIMMTVVRADRAAGTILGRPLGHFGKRERIGYLPENVRFPGYLTGRGVLDYFGALAGMARPERRRRAGQCIERLGLGAWADRRVDRYSRGMMQRLGLSQAIINDPDLIVLDEPTDGLDPVGQRDVRELLVELKRVGKTIFLNAHAINDLETVCDRVAVLVDGLVARQGRLSELTQTTMGYRVVCVGELAPLRARIESLGAALRGNTVEFNGADAVSANRLIDLLRNAGIVIESVVPNRFSLEDVLVQSISATGTVAAAPGKL